MVQRIDDLAMSIRFEEIPVKGYSGVESFRPDAWARLPLKDPVYQYQVSKLTNEKGAMEEKEMRTSRRGSCTCN